jgi:hypothetical protein
LINIDMSLLKYLLQVDPSHMDETTYNRINEKVIVITR